MKHQVKEPICVFNAANGRLSMSSGPHPCFPPLEMMMGLTSACQQLYIHLFKRAVGFSGVKITHLHPNSSLAVSRALHGPCMCQTTSLFIYLNSRCATTYSVPQKTQPFRNTELKLKEKKNNKTKMGKLFNNAVKQVF